MEYVEWLNLVYYQMYIISKYKLENKDLDFFEWFCKDSSSLEELNFYAELERWGL